MSISTPPATAHLSHRPRRQICLCLCAALDTPAVLSELGDTVSDNMAATIVPDPKMTPGATLPVPAADIAVSDYSMKVRNVPLVVK